jgi:hypothetical protein
MTKIADKYISQSQQCSPFIGMLFAYSVQSGCVVTPLALDTL